jgi:GntR family transcriptional regulator/MocR family aminotransferase
MLNLKLKRGAKSIQLGIYGAFLDAIHSGLLKPTDKIPSTRELADYYKCHRFTVMAAMRALIAEGWIESTERCNYRVSDRIPIVASKSKHKPTQANTEFSAPIARPADTLDLEKRRFEIEFWGGQPDLRLFPRDEFRKVLSYAVKRLKPDDFSYGASAGMPALQRQISEYLRRTRSLTNKEMIITNGSQEGLLLVAQMLIKPGDAVAIEAKGYPPAWFLFKELGAKLIPIAVDSEGIVTKDLARIAKKRKISLIYTTPLHQYPTTVTLSPRRRQHLIKIAESHKIPILEDDYDHEFHYDSPPPQPLSCDTVYGLYICSFSKILFPGARLGAIFCAPEIKRHLEYHKFLTSRQTEALIQVGLAAWIQEGGFERHLRRMRRVYEERRNFMLERLEAMKQRHGLDWSVPCGGMSIWLNLHRNSAVIAESARAKGILFQHEAELDFHKSTGTHLRIGFAPVNESEILKGMSVLDKLLSAGRG